MIFQGMKFMQEALLEAKKAFAENEVPVGAILVNRTTREIVARAHNTVERTCNPLNHAEMLVINKVLTNCDSQFKNEPQQKKCLTEYDLYVTLSPCLMCSHAIALAQIGRVFYGAERDGPHCLKGEYYSGYLEEECSQILKDFFKKVRAEKNLDY